MELNVTKILILNQVPTRDEVLLTTEDNQKKDYKGQESMSSTTRLRSSSALESKYLQLASVSVSAGALSGSV